MEWRGRRRLSHGSGSDHRPDTTPIEHHDGRLVVAFSWSDRGGTRHEGAQVLELTDSRITAMQDYAKLSSAALAARLRALGL